MCIYKQACTFVCVCAHTCVCVCVCVCVCTWVCIHMSVPVCLSLCYTHTSHAHAHLRNYLQVLKELSTSRKKSFKTNCRLKKKINEPIKINLLISHRQLLFKLHRHVVYTKTSPRAGRLLHFLRSIVLLSKTSSGQVSHTIIHDRIKSAEP